MPANKQVKELLYKAYEFRDAALLVATPQAKHRIEEIEFHYGYAEPGYNDPASGVIATGNWNSITRDNETTGKFDVLDDTAEKLAKQLEELGVELEWSDEWTACMECQKLLRTSPDSYGWTRSYWETECGALCQECVRTEPKSYLEDLEGNHRKAHTLNIDLATHGYKRLAQEFENGLYGGQDADPAKIAGALREREVTRFIFEITSKGQFDCDFCAWVHKSQWQKLKGGALPDAECKGDDDPAELMKRGLQSISAAEAAVPPGDGPVVVKVRNGTATAKRVTNQDFIDGKALD